jgi:hypothetical protein
VSRGATANFRARGIRVHVRVYERTKIEISATTRVKKRLSRKRTSVAKRTITRKRTLIVHTGSTALRIAPNAAGRSTVGPRARLNATVTLKARMSTGRLVTVNRTTLIARSTKS